MRVFVTGVKGQLGHDVMNELAKRGHEGIGVDIEEMDITDAESVRKVITEANPDVVIHCEPRTLHPALPPGTGQTDINPMHLFEF